MAKGSIVRKDKKEGYKPGAGSANPDRKVSDQSKGEHNFRLKLDNQSILTKGISNHFPPPLFKFGDGDVPNLCRVKK